ncbi:MAG: ABC transporter permease subunit [bacterium]
MPSGICRRRIVRVSFRRMLRYVIRRIFQLIPVLIGISLITFTLSFIIPGDPVRSIMGQRSDREIELRIRQKFGLDKPWYVQYFIWVRNLVRNPGRLPSFKIRDESGGGTYQFDFQPDTFLATDGKIRKNSNEPFNKQVLTNLIERGCLPPESEVSGGSVRTIVEIDKKSEPKRILLGDFRGENQWYEIDDSIQVCTGEKSGGLELLNSGGQFEAYFRGEGFQTGRLMTAIFDSSETEVIDGMYDDASIGNSEVSQLAVPVKSEIVSVEKTPGGRAITLRNDSGKSGKYEILPNAVLMLGGNRSSISDIHPGDSLNVAFTNKKENKLLALYDEQSSQLPIVAGIHNGHPESKSVSGQIYDINLTPAVWFDFGRSYRQQREVRDIIRGSFKNTAYLSVVAMAIAVLIGIAAGIISAIKPYSILDYLTMTAALFGVSMPVFWLGLMMILLFQTQLHWIGGIGYGEIVHIPINLGLFVLEIPWHQEIILPSLTLATVPMAIIARMTRSSMLEVMNLDYIKTARAKGLTEWTVIMRHALKNALIPIITVIGMDFAILLAGAVLTETVFSWPGLGREIVDAIEFRDFPVVMAGVVLFAFVFVIVNLIVDILYAYVDPRIRYT